MNLNDLLRVGAKDYEILFNIVISFFAGALITLGYCFARQKRGYSKGFIATILLLPIVVVVVIPLIATDLKKALSLAGIFALVRFRSVPGEAKDIFYIFYTITVGVAIALNYYLVAFVLTLIVSVIFVLISRYFNIQDDQLLKITIPEDMNYNGVFDDVFKKYLKAYELKDVKTTSMGTLFIISYAVQLKNQSSVKEMIDELRTRNGNLSIILQMDPDTFQKL